MPRPRAQAAHHCHARIGDTERGVAAWRAKGELVYSVYNVLIASRSLHLSPPIGREV